MISKLLLLAESLRVGAADFLKLAVEMGLAFVPAGVGDFRQTNRSLKALDTALLRLWTCSLA